MRIYRTTCTLTLSSALALALAVRYNWFPSSVFVGDTYCYFAGAHPITLEEKLTKS